MKLIFAGTPEFAAKALEALVAAGHEIALVLTQPDRPAGRGMNLQPSAVKQVAVAHGFPVFQPPSLRDAEAQQRIAAVGAEVMVVAAYGLILPQAVLDIPKLGCLNIHASLLPRWRGAAPIQRAIEAGDAQTGVCIMQMEAGLDTGPVLSSGVLEIGAAETAAQLHDRLTALGAAMIVEVLRQPIGAAVVQPVAGVSYAHKIEKAEALIDWSASAVEIGRKIRAFNPFPAAQADLEGLRCKLWMAEPLDMPHDAAPGTVLSVGREGLVIACGRDAVRVTELQKAGGKRLSAAQFLAGHSILPGQRFSSAT